jgi:hypothetical protein
MGRKAEKFELGDISGDAPNHVSHFLSASKARKYRCITSASIAVHVPRTYVRAILSSVYSYVEELTAQGAAREQRS